MPKDPPLRVTDHAVLRYLERAMGFNIDIVREHIASVCAGPAAVGAVCVRAENVRFEIVNNTVTTVTPDRINPSHTSRERNQRTIERTERDRIESSRRNPDLRPLHSLRARPIPGTIEYGIPGGAGFDAVAYTDAVAEAGAAGFPDGTFSDAAADKILSGG